MSKISFKIEDNVFLISLSNNSVNSISISMLRDLHKVLNDINLDEIRAVVFASSQKHFCAGADLKERSGFSKKETLGFLDSLNDLYFKIESLEIPTIAVVNGACLGGGLELALSCDFRIGLDDSVYSFPETSIGIIPGAGGTQRMTSLVGLSKAMEWIFTADKYSCDRALADGVIDYLVSSDKIDIFLNDFVSSIVKNAPIALRAAKNSINSAFIDAGYKTEREQYLKTLNSKDRDEGLASFRDKRSPDWKNK